jgi:hypothetical protein
MTRIVGRLSARKEQRKATYVSVERTRRRQEQCSVVARAE